METALGIFSAFGLSASAGLNAYIPLLVIALMARFTNLITLSKPWDALTSWWIIGLLVVLTMVEFLVDKFPAINHVNDFIVQTFVRPAAGAIAFAASANVITALYTIFWVIVLRRENTFENLLSLTIFISAGFATAMLQITLLTVLRGWLIG